MRAPRRNGKPSQFGGAYVGKRGSLEERFWRYVEKGEPDTCWLWKGTITNDGYGLISLGGMATQTSAHRASYMLHVGPIPEGMVVCHRCDVPACVNPNHLFVGTVAENNADRNRKGRTKTPIMRGSSHPASKLSADQVREIRSLYPAASQRALASRFGVSSGTISDIIHRRRWAWL